MAISGPHNVRDLYRDTTGQFQTSAESSEFVTCTSGSRPSSPVAGNVIYETDTGYLYVYDGSAWDRVRQTNDTVASTLVSGTILQTVYRADGTQQSATTAFNSVCYAYITPVEANSKILVLANVHVHHVSAGDSGYGFYLYNSQVGSNLIGVSRIGVGYDGTTGSTPTYTSYVHTGRNSTANQYYQIVIDPYQNNAGTTAYVNRNYQQQDYCWMNLLEIKA